MKQLLALIIELTNDNKFISEFIDRNINFVKNNEIDKLNQETNMFYPFINEYIIRNNKFNELMKKNKFQTIWSILLIEEYNSDEIKKLLKEFESSVKEAQNKKSLYSKLISGELNMINKIKYYKNTGNIDFKL